MKTTKNKSIAEILTDKKLDSDFDFGRKKLNSVTAADVEKVLSEPAGFYDIERLAALVSPAAENYLEQMAHSAHRLTIQRFGRTVSLYAPLYLSNYCVNSCRYCGFSKKNESDRIRLNTEQVLGEAKIIRDNGFEDILLVSGEDRDFVTVDYLAELAGKLREMFSSVSVEIYPMSKDEYSRLFEAGIEGVTLYQETYNRRAYSYYHPTGPKSDYDNRLNTHDRCAASGMRELGVGALLGLTDWRVETLALAEHAHYLMKKYWQSRISFSFPRLRPAFNTSTSGGKYSVNDRNLVQMITALRLCFADAGLVLSTRESARLRNHLIKLGITKVSAGSKTSPGGYSDKKNKSSEQFETDDKRSPSQVAVMLQQAGYNPVWKNWDKSFRQ